MPLRIIEHYTGLFRGRYDPGAMTHAMALEVGQSSQGTFEPITPGINPPQEGTASVAHRIESSMVNEIIVIYAIKIVWLAILESNHRLR